MRKWNRTVLTTSKRKYSTSKGEECELKLNGHILESHVFLFPLHTTSTGLLVLFVVVLKKKAQ